MAAINLQQPDDAGSWLASAGGVHGSALAVRYLPQRGGAGQLQLFRGRPGELADVCEGSVPVRLPGTPACMASAVSGVSPLPLLPQYLRTLCAVLDISALPGTTAGQPCHIAHVGYGMGCLALAWQAAAAQPSYGGPALCQSGVELDAAVRDIAVALAGHVPMIPVQASSASEWVSTVQPSSLDCVVLDTSVTAQRCRHAVMSPAAGCAELVPQLLGTLKPGGLLAVNVCAAFQAGDHDAAPGHVVGKMLAWHGWPVVHQMTLPGVHSELIVVPRACNGGQNAWLLLCHDASQLARYIAAAKAKSGVCMWPALLPEEAGPEPVQQAGQREVAAAQWIALG